MSGMAPSTLARAVVGARRGMDMSVAEVARASGVPERQVLDAESGVPVAPEVARDLCLALALPLDAHVPDVGAPPPARFDARHGKAIDLFADLASRDGGLLVLPDVVAMDARLGMTSSEREVLEGEARRWTVVDRIACTTLAALPVFFGCAIAAEPLRHLLSETVLDGIVYSTGALCFGGLGAGLILANCGCDTSPARKRKTAVQVWDARRAGIAMTAYVVTRTSLTVLEVADGLVRREVLASSFASVKVVDEDAEHLTVTVEGLLGRVEMPWVRRTRDLTDVLTAWSARCGSTATEMLP